VHLWYKFCKNLFITCPANKMQKGGPNFQNDVKKLGGREVWLKTASGVEYFSVPTVGPFSFVFMNALVALLCMN